MTKITGGCLCGAVRYESSGAQAMAGICQCVDCRKSSGAGHCAHMGVPEPGVSVSGPATAYARAADSGHIVTRHFCATCGSALFSSNDAMPGMIFLRASSLDDPNVFVPQMVVYASRAPAWDRPGEGLPRFDTMPPGM